MMNKYNFDNNNNQIKNLALYNNEYNTKLYVSPLTVPKPKFQ